MRKLALTAAALLALTNAAHADWNHRYGPRPGYGGGGGGWVAPLVGGLIIGGAIGAMAQPRVEEVPPYHVECRREQVFDRYGNFLGFQRRCYNVPNY